MDVSKFIIDGNEVNIKDAEARNLIAGLSDDVTTAQNTADGAQNAAKAAQGTADDALTGLDLKQDAASALKYDRASRTFTNVTIPANSDYQFPIPIPDGVTNPRPIYARTTSLSLVITNMYVVSPNMIIYLKNTDDTAVTASNVTVEVTYLYN